MKIGRRGAFNASADMSAPRRAVVTSANYILLESSFGGGLVLQPPFPLQEFLPLQPLSPLLQPPWPLQSFLALQSCLPLVSSSSKFALKPASWETAVLVTDRP